MHLIYNHTITELYKTKTLKHSACAKIIYHCDIKMLTNYPKKEEKKDKTALLQYLDTL